jgi:hypothetical protein
MTDAALYFLSACLLAALGVIALWLSDRAHRDSYDRAARITSDGLAQALRIIAESQARQEEHLRGVMDRMLARTFEEYSLSRMIAGEVAVDQQDDGDGDDAAERAAMEQYIRDVEAEMSATGGRP